MTLSGHIWQFNDMRPRRGLVADVYFILVFRSLCTSGVYCTCTARLMNWPASTASRVKSMMTSAKVARSPPSVVQAGRGRFSHGYKKTDSWQQPPGLVIVSSLEAPHPVNQITGRSQTEEHIHTQRLEAIGSTCQIVRLLTSSDRPEIQY